MSNEPARSSSVPRPPGPSGYPLVGSLFEYVRDPFAFVERCAREYGDIAYYEVFGRPFYQVNDPDGIEHVLVHNNENYVKGGTVLGVTRAGPR